MAEVQRVLGGRYLLKDKVGNGGMASVYRAQDQVLDRTVAVKIMLPQYAGDATFAARFKQEAQAAAGLQSPYIVGVYDWGKDGDTYYIVMEYLRGTDLKSGVRSHGALDPKKVAQIGSQICGALSVAHKHEIIHRDIKPQNIMVLPDGNIKVMDFGIARAKNSHLTQDLSLIHIYRKRLVHRGPWLHQWHARQQPPYLALPAAHRRPADLWPQHLRV